VTQPVVLNVARFPAREYVMIGGDRSPGKATIRGASSPRGWDERKGYALSGATLVPSGNPLGEFEILFEFWDETQIPLWYSFASKYFDESVRLVPGTLKPKALGIEHPILSAPPLRITEAVVLDATQLDMDETGLWSCTVKFKRYRKALPALSPPDASIPAAQKPAPTAQDAAEREIQEKLATFRGLAGQ
jgi:hypothetical protein